MINSIISFLKLDSCSHTFFSNLLLKSHLDCNQSIWVSFFLKNNTKRFYIGCVLGFTEIQHSVRNSVIGVLMTLKKKKQAVKCVFSLWSLRRLLIHESNWNASDQDLVSCYSWFVLFPLMSCKGWTIIGSSYTTCWCFMSVWGWW